MSEDSTPILIQKLTASAQQCVQDAVALRLQWNQEFPKLKKAQDALTEWIQKSTLKLHRELRKKYQVSYLQIYLRTALLPFRLLPSFPTAVYIVAAIGAVLVFCGYGAEIQALYPPLFDFFYHPDGTANRTHYNLFMFMACAYLFFLAPIWAFFDWNKRAKLATQRFDSLAGQWRYAAIVAIDKDNAVWAVTQDTDPMHWIFQHTLENEIAKAITDASPLRLGIVFFEPGKPCETLAAFAISSDKIQCVLCSNKMLTFAPMIATTPKEASEEHLNAWRNLQNYFQCAGRYRELKQSYIAICKRWATLDAQKDVWRHVFVHPDTRNELLLRFENFTSHHPGANEAVILYGPQGSGKEFLSGMLAYAANVNFAILDKTAFRSAETIQKAWDTIRTAEQAIVYIPESDTLFENEIKQETLQIWLNLMEVDRQQNRPYWLIFGAQNHEKIPASLWRALKIAAIELKGLDSPSVFNFFEAYAREIHFIFKVPPEYVKLFTGSTYTECKRFMDAMGDAHTMGKAITPVLWQSAAKSARSGDVYTYEEALNAIQNMVGLSEVKKELTLLINQAQLKQKFSDQLNDVAPAHHVIFAGNPGTGKTTVARYLATIYHHWGIIRKNLCVECTRKDLVGEFVGETSKKAAAKISEALGGVLFIDEAYTLLDTQSGYGKEAINEILTAMENHRNDLIVIVAGYTKEMQNFIDANPGFSSRFKKWIHFEDFAPAELYTIFERFVTQSQRVLDAEAIPAIQGAINTLYARRDEHFGNAREIRKLFENCVAAQQNRLLSSDKIDEEQLKHITKHDIVEGVGSAGPDEKHLEEALHELNTLVGLSEMKKQIQKMLSTAKRREEQINQGQNPPPMAWHMVFSGNPGTGKTTVARLMGKIFKAMNFLPSDKVTEIKADQLIAGYTGQTASHAAEIIHHALGGILFVDEAYALADSDYGKEAVLQLMSAMEDHRANLVVILAGYTDSMHKFFTLNPGLESRVPLQNRILFENYTQSELFQILTAMLQKQKISIHEPAIKIIENYFLRLLKNEHFGNAREVRNFSEAVVVECANEGSPVLNEKMARAITGDTATAPSEATLDEAMRELKSLIGLSNVKNTILQFVALMKFNALQAQKGITPPTQSYHMIFQGAPSTGKTTVARIMGKIFKALGILKTDRVVEVDRSGLVAGFTGQTALKTKEVLMSALDGVLFIDEAYALVKDANDAYGNESLQVLLKFMEDHRDRIVVIAAGYTQEMETFLNANSGFRSRFQNTLHFKNYTPTELMAIWEVACKAQALESTEDVKKSLRAYFEQLTAQENPNFANAREVRNIFDKILRKHAENVTQNNADVNQILAEDLSDIIPQAKATPKPPKPPEKADKTEKPKSAHALPYGEKINVEIKIKTDHSGYILKCPCCKSEADVPMYAIENKMRCPVCNKKFILHNDFKLTLIEENS